MSVARGAGVAIDDELRLGDGFPAVGYDAWKAKVVADLNGAPFEKKLVGHTEDGITLQPLYTATCRS